MASLEQRNGIYRIVFRLNGEKFSRSLRTKCASAADLVLAQLKDSLHRLKLGLLQLEPEDDVITAVLVYRVRNWSGRRGRASKILPRWNPQLHNMIVLSAEN